jgi:(R,R)-butanediol dehydrogenase / meso-butanediol dehydrogenase / diacetyl reductase
MTALGRTGLQSSRDSMDWSDLSCPGLIEEPRSMRAAYYMGGRRIEVGDAEAVPPGAGLVQVDVAYTGICGTDLHIVHGAMDARVSPPAILGHEMAGRVAATGDGVEAWRAGDPVTVMPLVWCGTCAACRGGVSHICQHLRFLGIDAPGSLQPRWTVPAHTLVPLPADMPLRTAALAEPTAVAVHDVRRAELAPGERAVVVGGGPIGLLIAAVAQHAGGDVLLVEPNDGRRELAESTGLDTLDPRRRPVAEHVEEWTEGAGVEVAFEVSGAVAGIQSAAVALGPRGRLVVVAIHPTPPPVDLFRVFWRELTIIGARVYERRDFEEAVRLLAAAHMPVEALVTDVLPLADVAEAFAALDAGDAMKILVDCAAAVS